MSIYKRRPVIGDVMMWRGARVRLVVQRMRGWSVEAVDRDLVDPELTIGTFFANGGELLPCPGREAEP